MYLLVQFCKECSPNPHIEMFITWLGYSNSAMNPIIYTVRIYTYNKINMRNTISRSCKLIWLSICYSAFTAKTWVFGNNWRISLSDSVYISFFLFLGFQPRLPNCSQAIVHQWSKAGSHANDLKNRVFTSVKWFTNLRIRLKKFLLFIHDICYCFKHLQAPSCTYRLQRQWSIIFLFKIIN